MERRPHLPYIPPELREQIYEELLCDQPSSLFHLLLVNRQFSREVKPWIFRQPLAFNGQQSLYRWLASVDPIYLPDVVDVRLVLHDLLPEQIVNAFGERLVRANVSYHESQSTRSPYKEAFDRELSQIRSVFDKFPNLKSFTLLENAWGDPKPPYTVLVAFAALVLIELPLVSFTMLQSVRHAMDQFRFPGLQHLKITDYAFHRTPGVPRFIEPFPDLYKLEICNSIQSITPGDLERNTCEQPTGPLAKLPVLQELVVCMYNYDERPSERYPTFESFELDIAAFRENAKSLKVFKLLCNHWIDRDSAPMQQLLYFIQTSSLSYIETSFWWSPHPNEYPKLVTTIAIRFTTYVQYSRWLHNFSDAIDPKSSTFFANHSYLKEIRLYLPSKAHHERDDHQVAEVAPKARCLKHGVQLKVLYKDFRCEHCHRGPFVSYDGPDPRRLPYGCYRYDSPS
ncbi:MAG: hypothetical protein Q9213_000600 [Squamulea squamosa]